MQTSATNHKLAERIHAAWVRRTDRFKAAHYAYRLADEAADRIERTHPDYLRARSIARRALRAMEIIHKQCTRLARAEIAAAGLTDALTTPAHAAAEWTGSQLAKAAALATITAADWSQTRTIARHPARWHETNPLLGEHPTQSAVDRHFIASAVLGAALLHALPSEWRDRALDVGLVLEVGCVANNVRLGIGIKF